MIRRLKADLIRHWTLFWAARDRDRDAALIKSAIADGQRRHVPVKYLQDRLTELRREQLDAAVRQMRAAR